jgi:hypothetical protein
MRPGDFRNRGVLTRFVSSWYTVVKSDHPDPASSHPERGAGRSSESVRSASGAEESTGIDSSEAATVMKRPGT